MGHYHENWQGDKFDVISQPKVAVIQTTEES